VADMRILVASRDSRAAGKPREAVPLTRRAALNSIAAALDVVARIGVELALNPLLVGRLGDHLYGAWRVLWRFTGSVYATTGRASQALKWSIANRQASADDHEKRELVGASVGVWVLFLPIMAVVGGALSWLAPTLLDTRPEFTSGVRWASLMLVAYTAVSSLVDVPRAILQGENLAYKRMGLTTFVIVLGGAFTAVALYLNTGIVGVGAANLADALLAGVLLTWVVWSYVPWAGMARPTLAALRSFLQLSGWFVVWKLVMQAMLAGDVLVLGMVGSVESVTIYTMTSFAPGAVLAVTRLLIAGVSPGLGGLVGAADWRAATRVRSELTAVTWLSVITTGATLLIWNRAFVELWVGGSRYAGTFPTLLIVIMVIQFALIRNDANIIDLTLSIRGKTLLGLLSTVVSLALAALLIRSPWGGGIPGLCLGIMAGRAIISVGYPWHVGRLFGLSWRRQLLGALRPTATTIALLALAYPLAGVARAGSWPILVLEATLTFAVVSALAFYLGLPRGERDALLRRLRKVIRARK
jgi:O-antigen/teichoic acid export membrane protein